VIGSTIVPLAGERDTLVLGGRLAKLVRPRDVIGLRGALGAGKTTLARGFIQALSPTTHDVPSPTFTLVQTYDDAKIPVFHVDLYRLTSSADLDELGLEDARAQGVVVIEWPERLGPGQFSDRLDIVIETIGVERRAVLTPSASWAERLRGFA